MSAPLTNSVAMGLARIIVRERDPSPVDVDQLARSAAPWVRAIAELDPGIEGLDTRAVSRLEWVELNLTSYGQVLARTLGTDLPLGTAELNSVVLGSLLSFVSTKVIGQYEPGMAGSAPALVIVEENLAELARAARVDEDEAGLWVMIHELTHRAQFHAVDWFLPELMGLVEELLAVRQVSPLEVIQEVILRLVHFDPSQGLDLTDLVVPRRLREVADRATSLMTVAEGHAEWVMRRVPLEVVPHRDVLMGTMDDRRGRSSLLGQLTGLSAKRAQYSRGLGFFEALATADPHAPRRVFDAPELLPTREELADPKRWLARVDVARG